MKNFEKLILAGGLAFAMAACTSAASSAPASSAAEEETKEEETAEEESKEEETKEEETAEETGEGITITGGYTVYIKGYDWGCGVYTAVVNLDAPLDEVSPEDFKVVETKQATDWTAEGFPVIEAEFERKVLGAEWVPESNTVVLDLYCSPNDGSPFLYSMATGYNTWCDPYYLTITLAEGAQVTSEGQPVAALDIATDLDITAMPTSVEQFRTDEYTAADGTVYRYGYYEPEGRDADVLFVWLHGAGEGGTENTDPRIIYLANRADAFACDDFQMNYARAFVLEPQCPTFWLDETGDGSMTNEHGGSIYTESLVELINWYKGETGASKVIIAGDSNGGFMTMNLAINNPEVADAYIPVCEAYKDEYISDEEIAELAKLPLFFIYSLDDTTVDPEVYEKPTIERLRAANAENLHVSTTDHVIGYVDEDDPEHEYSGHWSWIYFQNNQSKCVDEDGITAWDWIKQIAEQ